uniref:Uncharacterized protein n=1 Tax=Anguilla anguilla TaxID=7936 RepID=A0A0E9V119_ANGAN
MILKNTVTQAPKNSAGKARWGIAFLPSFWFVQGFFFFRSALNYFFPVRSVIN